MATSANRGGSNWDYYNDRPISERNHLLASIRESNAIVNSTKPTEFQQRLNEQDRRQSNVAADQSKQGLPNLPSDKGCSDRIGPAVAPNVFEERTYTGNGSAAKFPPFLGAGGVWIMQATTKTHAKAETYDEGKLPLAWLPWGAIEDLSRVQQYGHAKYKDFNNYRKGMEVSRNLSCALRHIREYLEGHDVDAESGLSPLAHAMCRIAFVLQNLKEGVAIDDRYKTQKPFNPDLEAVIKESLRNKP